MPRFLIPIGGNEKKSPDSKIFQEMVELAGGSKARIIVVPTASEAPGERARDYRDLFSAFSPESIETVHIGERSDAGSASLSKLIGETTLFMFAGGDQLRLSSLIGGTLLHRALIERYRLGGCVVAGTSAGAAVIPEAMIFQNNRFRVFRKGGIEMTKGLGLIQDTIFDTHFVQRSRISRLVHAIATNPAMLGLGIEENTGLLIEDERTARVIGHRHGDRRGWKPDRNQPHRLRGEQKSVRLDECTLLRAFVGGRLRSHVPGSHRSRSDRASQEHGPPAAQATREGLNRGHKLFDVFTRTLWPQDSRPPKRNVVLRGRQVTEIQGTKSETGRSAEESEEGRCLRQSESESSGATEEESLAGSIVSKAA